MTHKLVAIGNSRGLILSRKLLAQAGLSDSSEVDVIVDDGRIVIEPKASSDPLQALRAKLKDVDENVLEAVFVAAAQKARSESTRQIKRRRGR